MFITETEVTGPMVRVWLDEVTPEDEDTLADVAAEHLETSLVPNVVDHGNGVFEAIFEVGYLA